MISSDLVTVPPWASVRHDMSHSKYPVLKIGNLFLRGRKVQLVTPVGGLSASRRR